MCHCHGGIRQEPTWISLLSPAAGPSFCIVYIASWMGRFSYATCCSQEEEGMAGTGQTVNLPRDAIPFHTFGCLSGIRLAAAPARGTEERRDATGTCPASSGLWGGSFWGSGLFSRESGSSPMGPGAAVASTGIRVSKSAFGPGSMATVGPKSERREGASEGRASCGLENHWVPLLAAFALQVR